MIKHNIPLAHKTWFQTGGSARFYTQPANAQEFADALAFARTNNYEVFVLGEGANILISDDGFDGLVIRPQIATKKITGTGQITAGAGLSFSDLIDYCLDNNCGGLEEFAGIPGTVGGSVYINIHYFQFLLSQFLVSATVIEKATGAIFTVDNAWFEFGYDQSKLLEKKHYVIDATFHLNPLSDLEVAYARGRRDEIIRHRQRRYPTQRTCGSFFRNFAPEELASCRHEKPLPYTAYYLDSLGVKGKLQCGGAIVSARHANMIVTSEPATSSDVIAVARTMQAKVHAAYGIIPQPECQLVGFKKYPLL